MSDPFIAGFVPGGLAACPIEAPSRAGAHGWRAGAGSLLLGAIAREVSRLPFDPAGADGAWGAAEASWRRCGGEGSLWHGAPWAARGTGWDNAQSANEHCAPHATRHPLLAACRFGGADSVAWVCSKPGVDPVVGYADAPGFWSFDRAARSGISGAFAPLWSLALSNGWGRQSLGEALSSWLMGAQAGPGGALGPSLSAASGALDWLMSGDPGFVLPLAPSSVFGCALVASIARDGPAAEWASRALIGFAPAPVWLHEAQVPDSETYEACQADPEAALTFAEQAVQMGRPEALRLLMEAGHPMPSPERAWQVLHGEPSGAEEWLAYRIIQERSARSEARDMDAACPAAAPSGGRRAPPGL